MDSRLSKLLIVLLASFILLAGLRLTLAGVSAAGSTGEVDSAMAALRRVRQDDLPEQFPIISDTISQDWVAISGDCIAFRDEEGQVYLHHYLTTPQQPPITISAKTEPDGPRKVAISQGLVVWRSDRPGEAGLWGYYDPACSDGDIFGSQIITPFQIISRTYAQAPALSGEMLTYMAWTPAGMWYIGLIELDADNNGVPDATEGGYDPAAEDLWIRLSCCASWPQGYAQVLPDIYWADDYKITCWYDNAGGDHIKCYDLSHDADHDGDLDWQEDDPAPWAYQFRVISNTKMEFDWGGVLAVHRDLLVWTDVRDSNLSGHDLYIADLDLDDDGILNHYDDPSERQTEFVLVNRPWDQQYPDIWWPFAVWADRRNGNQKDIYAYDLSLDSDGDGLPNWKDPDRFCLDPAEFPVTLHSAIQTAPEVWDGTVIWEDNRHGNRDIFGAHLQPVQPQPRPVVGGTAQEKAVRWLDQQTVPFSQVQSIPGYINATGLITRYKSFMQAEVERVRQAWYPAIPGAYVVSYDFCYYGTPDQKRYLGRFGRGFIYDQALALIGRAMLGQPAQAEELGRFISSFQNSGQLTTTTPGSFGFSFNGQGYWGEKDNFYDMDYLRGGANGWLGYGYLFYTRHYSNDRQFMDVTTRLGDYILSQQVLTEADPRYGLFTGGYGGYYSGLISDTSPISDKIEFSDTKIEWVSTEHNIDIYFFLRDLGRLTGDSRYINAANLQKANMVKKLWNEAKGRFDQGLNDPADALDAASWGAMYLLAVGDLAKAKRSLEYADRAYSNTVTVSSTVTVSPERIWGYKPYTGTVDGFNWSSVDLVWSEGSLGVAMANLKLGYALLDRCDTQGNIYLQKAMDIVTAMKKLQNLDPEGGVFYAVYPDYSASPTGVITDFARAPSVAGAAWLVMVKRALADKALGDAFWGTDSASEGDPLAGPCQFFLPVISKRGS